jgi:ADP-ribose pyrophosphatase YjhB (NUDIX family)
LVPTVGVFAAIFDDDGRILCVRRAYGPRNWTIPGGRLEPRESPTDALLREVAEETGYVVRVSRFVGVYSAPFRDDLVLMFVAEIIGRSEWRPNDEIAEARYFRPDDLPDSMTSRTLARIRDAVVGKVGVLRVFADEGQGL